MAVATRRIAIRRMTPADLRQVRRIERLAYGSTLPGTPFERELDNGLAHYFVAVERDPVDPADSQHTHEAGGVLGSVRRLFHLEAPPERIVGFAGVWYTHDQLHVVTVAVDPADQHRGVAQRLLLEAYALARTSELRTIALEVRASNDRARRLYEWFGFQRTGMLRAYYSDNGEDAIVMLTPELDAPDQLARLAHLRDEHQRRYGEHFEAFDDTPASAAPEA